MHCGSKVRYFYWELTVIFLFTKAFANIPIQTLIFRHDSYFARWSSNSWNLGSLWYARPRKCVFMVTKMMIKIKKTFLFLSVYSNWTRDASLHPYCSPNIWHPTRGIDGCAFYFSPIFKLFREIFYETTTQLSNVEHGLENQSWPASPISRAKFSKENLRNNYMYCCAKHAKKKIKTILEIWAEVWPLCSNQRPKPKQMPCLLSLTEFQWCQ